MSIGEACVDLNTGGFTLITAVNNRVEDSAGSNGSGKSSIAEAILWGLTGETIRGHKEVVNRYTEGECLVRVELEFKGQNWAIERSMSRSKEKSLLVYRNSVLLEAKGYRDAQEVLQKELPELTPKFINSVIILGQGLPGRFTNNTPAGRKAVLEELTNADFMITQVKEGIKSRSEFLSNQLRQAEDGLLKCNTQSTMVLNTLNQNKLLLGTLKETDLESFKAKKEELTLKVNEIAKELETNEGDLVKALDSSNQTRDAWKDSEARLDSEVGSRTNQLVKEQAEIKEKYSKKISEETMSLKERMLKGSQMIKDLEEQVQHNKAKINGGVCRTCGQKLANISSIELSEARRLVEEGESNLARYRDLYKQLSDSENVIFVKLKNEEASELSKAREIADKDSAEISRRLGLEVNRLKQIHDKAREEASRLSLRRSKISEDLNLAKDALSSVTHKLDNHLNEIDRVEKLIKASEGEISSLSADRETLEIKISDLKNRSSIVKQMETFASRDFRGILLEGIISRMNDIVGGYSEVVYGNRLTNFSLSGNSIQIEFDGKEYESLSGGEQQKMNVILQLSLRDLIIELTGNTGSILFLDEIFDGLDSVGCEKMVELVQRIDTSTFVISHHHEHLSLPYDYILTVVKEPNGVAHVERGM